MTDNQIDAAHVSVPVTAKKPFPSIWAGLISIAAFLGLQIVFGIIAVLVAIAFAVSSSQVSAEDAMNVFGQIEFIALPSIWAMVLSNIAVLIGLYFYLRKDGRAAKIHLDVWSQIGWVKTTLSAIAVIAFILAFSYVYQTYIVPGIELQGEMRRLLAAIPDTTGNTILLFFAIAILAPVVEELVFRGLLQTSLMNYMNPYLAIGLASVIFGAIHFQFYAFPVLAVLGAAFGYLYYVTGSLRVNIVAHVLNNAFALLQPYLFPYVGT